MSEASVTRSREDGRDTIERFLDRSWILERTPVASLSKHRITLGKLDFWMQRHRKIPLTDATARDMRALLDSSHWDAISYGSESLLKLVTSFFQSLQETRYRADDPIVTIIDQEMAAAAKRAFSRPARVEKRRPRLSFSFSTVI
jgi:site-specific recombinase XerD